MYAAKYIFDYKFFAAWVVVSIIWVWGTMLIAGFFPIIDGWRQIRLVFRGLSRKNKAFHSGSDSAEVVDSKGPAESTVESPVLGTKRGSGNGEVSS